MCGLDSSNLGYGLLVGFFELGCESSDFIKGRHVE